tara:strand:- start:2345 stop:2671 length:327 start_codon:yes stop_codon:yes gene_type:complete
MRKPWTKTETELLVMRVNENLSKSGTVRWRNIPNIAEHPIQSMKNKWSSDLRPLHDFNGRRYVLKQSNLFDRVTPTPKVDNARRAPLNKRVKVSRSFLWGAIKFERYE